ncbi:MAG: class I SAM-dependent methyltransferase [Aureibaculum sp.]
MLQHKEDNTADGLQVKPLDYVTHWNKVYTNAEIENLGWYENDPKESLELIEKCKLDKDAAIFISGAGATTLVDELLKRKYTHIIANDIAEAALISLKSRIGKSESVKFVIDDLTKPKKLQFLPKIDLWIDRAVLHFFLKEEDQKSYFDILKQLVKPKGYVIIAAFNLKGAKKCSGLDVFNYDADMIANRLGNEFKLITTFDHTYVMPSGGERPYVYTLFQRR